MLISFADYAPDVHYVPAYSDHYSRHPSMMLATADGWITAKPHMDRWTGKGATEMEERRKRIRLYDTSSSANAHARRELILNTLELNNSRWLDTCVNASCVVAFINSHCHYSQCRSGDQRLSNVSCHLDVDIRIDNLQQIPGKIHMV